MVHLMPFHAPVSTMALPVAQNDMAAPIQSLFLTTIPEIRLSVYGFLFTNQTLLAPIKFHPSGEPRMYNKAKDLDQDRRHYRFTSSNGTLRSDIATVLQVCMQIYDEAKPVMHQKATFMFRSISHYNNMYAAGDKNVKSQFLQMVRYAEKIACNTWEFSIKDLDRRIDHPAPADGQRREMALKAPVWHSSTPLTLASSQLFRKIRSFRFHFRDSECPGWIYKGNARVGLHKWMRDTTEKGADAAEDVQSCDLLEQMCKTEEDHEYSQRPLLQALDWTERMHQRSLETPEECFKTQIVLNYNRFGAL